MGSKYNDDAYQNNYDKIVDKSLYPFLISESKQIDSLKRKLVKCYRSLWKMEKIIVC